MSENDFSLPPPDHPHRSQPGGGAESSGPASWPLSRWLRGGTDRAEDSTTSSSPDPGTPAPAGLIPEPTHDEAAREVITPQAPTTYVGNADVVANRIDVLKQVTRTRDVLEGVERRRQDIVDQPFVREGQWTEAWEQAIDPETRRLRQPVLIVVAPRSFGSTTFALHLLARHTSSHTTVVKLDADWAAPSRGRLPLEKLHAFQLDLKDESTDQLSADFLDSLTQHARELEARHSCLVLTVAKELWHDHYLTPRPGLHVVHLHEPPNAQRVIEEHLSFRDHPQLIPYIQSLDKARVSLNGLNAVEAVQAAVKAITVWKEHARQQHTYLPRTAPGLAAEEAPSDFEKRLIAALSDWREKLDGLFGEVTAVHEGQNASLTLEDRCLLLALAVRQSAPMTEVASTARGLQDLVTATDRNKPAAVPVVQAVFAGRGLRRRIHDVGARVDSHDTVLFDQPSYGRAILTYVWDNYEVMREPLLTWLAQASGTSASADSTVDALASLVLRHSTAEHLDALGQVTRSENPALLGSVMLQAVQDEHVGRLAWATLYRWAKQPDYATTVISTCRRVLHDPSASPSMAKMAMVRLRRIAHTAQDPTTRLKVLRTFQDLAQQPAGATWLVAEVNAWQSSKTSDKSGSLAFIALMSVNHDGMPWLMSEAAHDIDVDQALQDLLGNASTAEEIIPRLTQWIRSYATDTDTYVRLRDRLVPALRGHNMFQACMELMRALADTPAIQGINVAEDFYQHLVDPRMREVFPLKEGTA